MSNLHRRTETMWWHGEPSLLLKAASRLYAAVNSMNLTMRQNRMQQPPLPMISVGNITAGGSGKTPFVIWLAGQLKMHGYRPVLLCRGDGGRGGEPMLLDSTSRPEIVGDEALLLFKSCDCPVVAGRDRIRGARMAAEYGDIIILDDGFQYRQLGRSCDIVLIPAEGVGNGHLIPAGPLREPIAALQRADLIVRTGNAGSIRPLTSEREWRWRTREEHWLQYAGTPAEPPERAVAVTAIARPERFLKSLEKMGVEVSEQYIYPDHHPFSQAEIEELASLGQPVVVTAKDAMKLADRWPESEPLWSLEQQAEAEEGLIEAILHCLAHEKADGVADGDS